MMPWNQSAYIEKSSFSKEPVNEPEQEIIKKKNRSFEKEKT